MQLDGIFLHTTDTGKDMFVVNLHVLNIVNTLYLLKNTYNRSMSDVPFNSSCRYSISTSLNESTLLHCPVVINQLFVHKTILL